MHHNFIPYRNSTGFQQRCLIGGLAEVVRMMVVFFTIFVPVRSFVLAKDMSDGIAAIVNNEVITLSELHNEIHDEVIRLKARFRGKEFERRLLQKQYHVLNDLIEKRLQFQEAKAKGFKISDDELDQALTRLGQNGQAGSFAKSREEIRKDLLLQKLLNFEVRRLIMVSPDEIREHYEKYEHQFLDSTRYRIRQILFLAGPGENLKETKREAENVYEKLKNGGDFSELAEQYSDGPERVRGGELGFIPKNELLVPIARALDTMKAGDISPPLESDLGIHIIILDAKESGKARSFGEVENKIRTILIEQKTRDTYQSWLTKLKEKAYIEIKL